MKTKVNTELSAKDRAKDANYKPIPEQCLEEDEVSAIDIDESNKRVLEYFAEQERLKQEREQGIFKGRKLPLNKEQLKSLNADDRFELRRWEEHWTNIPWPKVSKPAEQQMLEAALGKTPCPACGDKEFFPGILYGEDTGLWEPKPHIGCWCTIYRLVQRRMDEMVGHRYRAYDFRTIKPSSANRWPLDKQQSFYADAYSNRDKNFLFLGSAGTGKTTTCSMLAREALWRHKDYLWESRYRTNPVRWVWVVDAEELFLQFAEWSTSRTSEKPKPEPIVTPAKVHKARALGLTPTIVLEELDKGRLTEPRFTFLQNLMNAMDKEEGQLIVTTNRRLDRFMALFTESENEIIRTSGEPLMRRFLQNNCVTVQSFI